MVMLINKIIAKHSGIGRLIEGRSTILVKKGKVIKENLMRENMNEDELKAELREKNIHRLSDLEEVVLEPTGRLSVKRKKRNNKR